MAAGDLNYNVSVDTSQAIRNIQNLNNSLGGLTTAFKTAFAGISIAAVTRFSDDITNLRNKLMLLSDSQEQANTQFKALAGIAVGARTNLTAVGDLYFRIARSARELGISQQEAANITDSLAKAMTASGLSANEAAGPLLQLGQALQSGVFQGDELRSILEGLPPVAKALADQLGVPVGALKKLGSEGQITAQDFVQAMRKARDAIEQDFAKTIPTISGAFNTLKTTTALAFDEFERNTQVGQTFALSIEYVAFKIYQLSKSIDQIIGPIGMLVQVVGTLIVFSVAGRIIAAFGAVLGRIATGFGSLTMFVRETIERMADFGKTMTAAGGGILAFVSTVIFTLTPMGRFLKYLLSIGAAAAAWMGFDKIKEGFKDLGTEGSGSRTELENFRKEMANLKSQLDTTASAPAPKFLDPKVMRQAKDELDQIVINYQRQNGELIKRLNLEQELIGASEQQRSVRQALFDLENSYLSEVNRLTDDYRKKSQSKSAEDQAQLPLIQEALRRVTEEYASQINIVKQLTNENYILQEAEKRRLALSEFSIRSQLDGNRELRKIQDDIAKVGMTEIEKKYYDIARASEESARAQIEQENARRRSLKLTEMTATEEQAYYKAAKANNDSLIASTGQLYEKSRQFSTGWTSAFQQYLDEATNGAKAAEAIFRKATQGMEDAIINFAKTGKFEWKNFVISMAEELLRSQIRQLMAQLFTIQSGGSSGGNFFAKLLGFANGGVIPTNKPVLVGERGPEIITGAAGRTVIPNEALGMAGSVTYYINAVDAASFKSLIARDPGFIHAVAQQGAKLTPARR